MPIEGRVYGDPHGTRIAFTGQGLRLTS